MSMMLQEKRATRGARMSDLVGEAAEQDSTFWADDVWAEDSEDDSFAEPEAELNKPDEFDSDFDESEDSGEENSDDNEAAVVRKAKGGVKRAVSSNKYKEPTQPRRKKVAVEESTEDGDNEGHIGRESPKKKKFGGLDRSNADLIIAGDRNVRESTKIKTEVAVSVRESGKRTNKTKSSSSKPVRRQFTQKELLEDALNTQVVNEKWLRLQKLAEDDKIASERPLKQPSAHYIRFISKRGAYNTITFSDVDLMPKILTEGAAGARQEYAEEEDEDES